MKKNSISFSLAIFLSLCFISSIAFSAPDLSKIPTFAPDRILIGFKLGTPRAEKAALHSQMGAKVEKTLDAIGVDLVSVPLGSVQAKVEIYKKNPNVKFTEPDYYRSFIIPLEGHDTLIGDYFTQQWPLHNTGQALTDPSGIDNLYICYLYAPLLGLNCSDSPYYPLPTYTGTSGADINALTTGGELSSGDPNVSIAILDSGIDCTNKDFEYGASTKCFDNQIFNGVSADTTDELPHGTLVSSIAAANAGDSAGIAGVSQGPMIANLKVCYPYDTTGLGDYIGLCPVSASAEAILYAANRGVTPNLLNHPYEVINMSYGSDCPDVTSSGPTSNCNAASSTENNAIQTAWDAGSVIVAAAGNDYGTSLHYPAAYDNVIAVASSDYNDNLSSFSTYGNTWVDLIAPGTNILSSAPDVLCEATCSAVPSFPGCPFNHNDGCVGYASGTSLASPHVAGVAAMVWSALLRTNPNATNVNVRDCIFNNADLAGASGQNFGAWTIHGKVNLQNALTNCSSQQFSLSVSKDGTGSGTVSGGSINCGPTCSANFDYGTSVTLTVVPATGSVFAGWSGASCSGTGTCTVTMDAAKSVTATFNVAPSSYQLTLTVVGNGSVSGGSGKNAFKCASNSTCIKSYPIGTSANLTEKPGRRANFIGWTGDCSGSNSNCNVTMNMNRNVTATFN